MTEQELETITARFSDKRVCNHPEAVQTISALVAELQEANAKIQCVLEHTTFHETLAEQDEYYAALHCFGSDQAASRAYGIRQYARDIHSALNHSKGAN